MFNSAPLLLRPNAAEQTAITDTANGGLAWVNDGEGCIENIEAVSYKLETIVGETTVSRYKRETIKQSEKYIAKVFLQQS